MYNSFEDRPQPSELPIMPQDAFNEVLRKHKMYLRGQNGGARAVLQYKNLTNIQFHNHDLSQADFTGSLLRGADLSLGTYHSACFFAADLSDADLSDANFERSDLRGANLSNADLSNANLKDADMRQGRVLQKDKKGILESRPNKEGKNTNDDGKTNLSGARFGKADLSGLRARSANFTDADLTEARLNNSNLNAVTMDGANLTRADLTGADLTHADMSTSILNGTNMTGAEREDFGNTPLLPNAAGDNTQQNKIILLRAIKQHGLWVETLGKAGKRMNISGYDLRQIQDLRYYGLMAIKANEACFIGMDLSDAEMQGGLYKGSDLRDCKMENCDLRGSSFTDAKLTRANLNGANLARLEFKSDRPAMISDFKNADLRYANFEYSDLRDVIFQGADLSSANLQGADLRRADFRGANMTNVNLADTIIDHALFDTEDS